jgi:hypothetical protein
MTPEVLAAIKPLIAAFEALGVAYHVGGSIASSAFGVARSTLDVDIVANLSGDHVDTLVRRLQASYYIDAKMMEEAIARKASFNIIHLDTMLKVDVFIPGSRPFDRECLERRRQETIEEGPSGATFLYMTSPEDIILQKLTWYRSGGEVSERQWTDVLGVIKIQGDALDGPYLLRWAGSLEVTDLLRRAFEEAGQSLEA